MINQNYFFHIFVTRNKENQQQWKHLLSNLRMRHLLNFQKNIDDKHVTNKVIINLKWRKFNHFYKLLIKGIKFKKSLDFLLLFIISFNFEELYSDIA